MDSDFMDDKGPKFLKWVCICLVGLILILSCIYTISAGYRGVLLTLGKPSDIVSSEGPHLKWPIIQRVVKMEVRTKKIEKKSESVSKDLQDVKTTIALNYHINPGYVNKLYQEVGEEYEERIIKPAIEESVKSVMAKFTASGLITERPKVRQGIQLLLTERLQKYYIMVDDFNIVNFQFSADFAKAIEDKVTAEQKKLKAERDLERIKIEKEQQIVKAQAEAEALRLQRKEITEELIELRRIEMQRAAIEKWDGELPEFMAPGAVPFFNIADTTR